MHVFISTGEVSGDLQGSLLIQALRREADRRGETLQISALGGPRMAAAGAQLLGDTSAIGSIGLWEALPFVWPTLKVQWQAQDYLRDNPPDVVVFIDYVGPNIGMGSFFRRHLPTVPTAYYIAPQEWVWSFGPRNTQQIVGLSDRILSIFPEEARYYRQHGATVEWVGHPLVDRLAEAPSRAVAREILGMAADQLAIALVPASRRQELQTLLPVLAEAAAQIQQARPEAHFWIPLAVEAYREPIQAAIDQWHLNATILNPTPIGSSAWPAPLVCLAAADLALSKSGTVNLETALLDVPQVIAYRVSRVTAWVAEHVLKFSVPFISPVNLVEMRSIIPELLQTAATPAAIAREALALLEPAGRDRVRAGYAQMRVSLGEAGASNRAAQAIWHLAIAGRSPATLKVPAEPEFDRTAKTNHAQINQKLNQQTRRLNPR